MAQQHTFQPPTGTRDLYPIEAARRRFITEAWRRVSINHGFEEIDGPTFETTELYTKKSGEGIVSEIFGVFSGKDEAGVKALGEKLAKGEDAPAPYALRPEFTPTLARMYAAKAASLPKPTKWFSVGPYFRAERPQRGRLREFLQWNADVLGLGSVDESMSESAVRARVAADLEIISCAVDCLVQLGLGSKDFSVRFNNRQLIESTMRRVGISQEKQAGVLSIIDGVSKTPKDVVEQKIRALGVSSDQFWDLVRPPMQTMGGLIALSAEQDEMLGHLSQPISESGLGEFMIYDPLVVRGLAYYTGTVFEVIVDNERAVAGGGRYDNLIELFGGPPTPAVGFGMGDVVLSLVLQDKGLMPSDAELMGLVGQSPDVFIISGGTPEAESQIPKLLAALRRATPRVPSPPSAQPSSPLPTPHSPLPSPGLHARRSYKTTKNIGKLIEDARKARARFLVIIETATAAKLKDLATNAQDDRTYSLEELPTELRRRLNRA